ncbi:MAG TPA: peptidoglycan glycosyltransferase [Clostridiales bacterium]|nr:MAG: peptidoglycan glycosyltransferase [Clostridiales bacterium GWD2_32_19]HCC07984.1 peptidoglycan glycosyltransferase [Clostridiales bacterium]
MKKMKLVFKRKIVMIGITFTIVFIILYARLFYIQMFKSHFLQDEAYKQQTRNRDIPAKRGKILDRNNVVLAESISVYTVYVINSRIKDEKKVSSFLAETLNMDYDFVFDRVSKKVAIQKLKNKIDKATADKLRCSGISGIIVDEDYLRFYPYNNLASQVLGFCGADNQGILGLEVKYDSYIKGIKGKILSPTDVKGNRMNKAAEARLEPLSGDNLVISIDNVVQNYSEQAIENALTQRKAKRVSILIMNPQNGEIYAMASKPDFNLNTPFELKDSEYSGIWESLSKEEQIKILNQRWRNFLINDTYEPGSIFKVVVSASALNEKLVDLTTTFVCNGFKIVADRKIRCWYFPRAHGLETFVEGVKNSCNIVFMELGQKLGVVSFYNYFEKFGFREKTGIDLPGEAIGIMHNIKKAGPVELAVMSFGQSFQITPIQLARACSATVNGGYLVTPHFGIKTVGDNGTIRKEFEYEKGRQVISQETAESMKYVLEQVVFDGTGHNAYIEGYRIGGKTATSEKLPRKQGKYISSFMAFAPADKPDVLALVLIDEPQGQYYGGVIAAPIIKEIFSNVLPYLGVEQTGIENENKVENKYVSVPNLIDKSLVEAKREATKYGFKLKTLGEGKTVTNQFPLENESINKGEEVIVEVR